MLTGFAGGSPLANLTNLARQSHSHRAGLRAALAICNAPGTGGRVIRSAMAQPTNLRVQRSFACDPPVAWLPALVPLPEVEYGLVEECHQIV